jgi:amino acid adenylation domain-containing protein
VDDIIIGTPLAGRSRLETEKTIGFFVNTLVLRTDLGGDPSFRDLLGRVREVCLGAFEHQDVPFERLVEELHPARNVSHSPLFQAMFSLQTGAGAPRAVLQDLNMRREEVVTETAKFDLKLSLVAEQGGLKGWLECDAGMFGRATMEQMAGHYERLLDSIVADPRCPISRLAMLSDAELRRQLVEWNATGRAFPAGKAVHGLFEQQVQRTPDAVALMMDDVRLTYGELNRRANQLAHALRTMGVAPDVPVGVCMDRSLGMVVSLLGILKAGGAYLPLDPESPPARLETIIREARLSLVLTQERFVALMRTIEGRVVAVDDPDLRLDEQSRADLDVSVEGDNLLYVIYTSGSTGIPKGVMVTHAGVCNRLLWMQDQYHLRADDRVLQKTPYSFDVSVWEIFWPLLNGACLVIATPGGHRDASYLLDVITEKQVSVVHFVPSMLELFLAQPGVERCVSLRLVIASGEPLQLDLQRRFFGRLQAMLNNLYGPTETTVDSTFWNCDPKTSLTIVPIGRPIANTQMYILDRTMHPVPVGVTGELYIGGAGVARGYLNRPALTAERFVVDPFSGDPSSRLYRTGDLGRYLPDGVIEYVGRTDYQVKIRGYRIELGEIEMALRSHERVREAVVEVQEEGGDKRLVAYYVAGGGEDLPAGELRSYLRERLPEYMVPAGYVAMEGMPLTANGKVDRKALKDVAWRGGSEVGRRLPEGPVEERLAEIWREVLGVREIGVEDNFFDVGGHSLLAFQVVARVRKEWDVDMTIVDVFENPSFADQACFIEGLTV